MTMSQGYLLGKRNSPDETQLSALPRPGGPVRAESRWLALAVAGAVAMTLADAVLMERRFGVFAGGFLTEGQLATSAERGGFLLVSVLADIVAMIVPMALTLALARRAGISTIAARFLALVVGLGPLVLWDLLTYGLLSYVGDAFDLSLMFDLVGGRPAEFLAVGFAHLLEPTGIVIVALAVTGVIAWLLHRRFPDAGPRSRGGLARSLVTVAAVVLLGSVVVTAVRENNEPIQFALRRKASAQAIAIAVNVVTDVDRDGYGLGYRPADPNPFDAAVRPYAVDLPGNGIDEDGIAGDLPPARVTAAPSPPVASAFAWSPDVLLVLLESVRADAVGATLAGKAVTPTLDRLAAEGAASAHAFSHNGFTYQSRYHLFTGRLTSNGGDRASLIDDFLANHYAVGYFSGQDDSFGGPELAVGFERATAFSDARSDAGRRYTQFTTPGSLAVPASVVTERALQFVNGANRQQPIFVYVNFHDTHFPYHHAGIDPIVSPTVVEQGAIAPGRAEDVRAMYLNTVANVDRSIGHLIDEVTRIRGKRPAVIVTSDHGESLFDEGFLGHGYTLNDAQTRVPFVAAGLPLRLEEPFAHADVRTAIQQALETPPDADSRPRFTSGSDHRAFQYLGSVDQPREIGVISAAGRMLYDFRTDRLMFPGGQWARTTGLPANETAQFFTLIYGWESLRLPPAARTEGTETPAKQQ